MNKFYLILTFLAFNNLFAQEQFQKYTAHNKGKFFVYWGGNRENYSKSDITFKGSDHDFTIYDVEAVDKPKGWHVDYINPVRMTIPQTNARIGYFFSDKYAISVGVDHMKYVMLQDKAVNITGTYAGQGTYDEVLPNNQVLLTEKFLTFEHTDGLNYVHTELLRQDDISKMFKAKNTDKFQLNFITAVGIGVLYPKTNTQLMGKLRHDEFHISGFGLSAKAGLNFTLFKHYFIQTDLKGGYINMPNVSTTYNSADSASQKFWFLERTIAFGGIFKI